MRGRRLILVILVVATVVIGAAYYGLGRRTAPQHNVLLITLDTTRSDRLSCYGYPQAVSPRIDRLASQGAIFDKAYAAAANTPVSHASLLTGQYPYTNGLRVMHGLGSNRLPDTAVTLAEILKEAGYQTAAFISAFPAGSHFGLQQGFDTFDEAFLDRPLDQLVGPGGNVNTSKSQRRADATTDAALNWLGLAKGRFFLWLHYFDPHDAYVIPPEEFLQPFLPFSGTPAERLRTLYDIEIRFMDQQIGRVVDALAAAGRLDDTVIVLVADHGQGLGDHNWWTHGILYQEQIKVPLIIRAPGVPAVGRVTTVVRTIDLAPTIIDLVGLDTRRYASIEGKSLVPMLKAQTLDPGYVAYADSVNMVDYTPELGTVEPKRDMLFAVTDGRWKYIQHQLRREESELYDLLQDPHELTNLYAERPAEVERLRQNLQARPFEPKPDQTQRPLSEEDRERLRSLGYLK